MTRHYRLRADISIVEFRKTFQKNVRRGLMLEWVMIKLLKAIAEEKKRISPDEKYLYITLED